MTFFTFSPFNLRPVRSQFQRVSSLRCASLRLVVVVAAALLAVCALPAQEEKPKIPGLDKIINAQEHLAFTGSVKSVDEKHNILSVNSVEGGITEIFPIKHSTRVQTSDGYRKRLDVLTPGTQVIVYYDQRADHRNVTRIELFSSKAQKKEPHS